MKSHTLAIAGTSAALLFAGAPVAAVAATSHHATSSATRVDRSRDLRGTRHIDRTPDRSSGADRSHVDSSRDIRDR